MHDRARLRVLLAVDDLRIGGAQDQVVGLAVALAERGHRVVLACTEGGGRSAERLARAGVPVVVLGRRHVAKRLSVSFAVRIARMARAGGFDVVHAHVHAASMAAALGGPLVGVPVVVTEHSMASWRGRIACAYSRLLYRRCALVLAVSPQIRNRLCTSDRVLRGRVRVVGTALFGSARAAAPGPERTPECTSGRPGGPVVGVVARLRPEKGVEFFVRAASLVADAHPDVTFSVVGDGDQRHRLEGLAAGLGLGGRMRFHGERADGARAVAAADVLCVPSLTEGAPLVVLEAMAAGVPVIASAVGAVPDQLDGGRAGILVPPGDVSALAEALDGLLADGCERARLGRSGHRRLRELGSADEVTREVEAAYRAVVGAAAGGSPGR
ncbi:glycosyltransferase family 4 protein [Streptodolium elevatio]|uniref:Glycosyltransferase family 4 protein n=1 Tax=Streptodolium elevatio TaxID=3157996 RepID=A0ABV3DKJ2_9ACTN